MTEVLYLPYERLLLAVITGVFCGAFYEVLRMVRLIISEKSKTVNFVIDVFFFFVLSFVVFFFSMMVGDGRIRLYYFIGMFVGIALYLFTIGKAIYLLNKSFVRLIKRTFGKIVSFMRKPIKKFFVAVAHKFAALFGKTYDFSRTRAKKAFSHLQKPRPLVYNNTVSNNSYEQIEGSEHKYAVKGRVRTNGH